MSARHKVLFGLEGAWITQQASGSCSRFLDITSAHDANVTSLQGPVFSEPVHSPGK